MDFPPPAVFNQHSPIQKYMDFENLSPPAVFNYRSPIGKYEDFEDFPPKVILLAIPYRGIVNISKILRLRRFY